MTLTAFSVNSRKTKHNWFTFDALASNHFVVAITPYREERSEQNDSIRCEMLLPLLSGWGLILFSVSAKRSLGCFIFVAF